MLRLIRTFLMLFAALAIAAGDQTKLVVIVMVDQFRYDYLTRFQGNYSGGLKRLLAEGAVFTNAHLDHFPTVTAVGHATVATGATPSLSGIINNEWYDRGEGRRVNCVGDPAARPLGGAKKTGASPERLLVGTIGDELKMAGRGQPRVIGVSLKDRGAILPAGRMADAAYWFDDQTGEFVSSTYYFAELPAWVREFNAERHSHRFTGAEWKALSLGANGPGTLFKKLPAEVSQPYFDSLKKSPFGNELLVTLSKRVIDAEQLGRRGTTDLLAISFSSNDHVGHDAGPDASEVRDISIRTDQALEDLFQHLDRRVGLANVLVVLTSDHGVAPLAEIQVQRRMPGGRASERAIRDAADKAIVAAYGPGQWILDSHYGTLYLHRELIRQKDLSRADVERAAAEALARVPHVARVYTRTQIEAGLYPRDGVSRRVANGFHLERSGDVIALLEPYWTFAKEGATHGSAYSYDTHLPVIFMGPGVQPGRYHRNIAINDIAPTLATLLEVETPSGSVGRTLDEMLAEP